MHRFRRLTVALSHTDTDTDLLAYTAAVARLGTVAEVNVVHVRKSDAADDLLTISRAIETDAAAQLAAVPPGVARSFDVVEGPRLDTLLAHVSAKQTDVLLLGHRRAHPGRWALARRLAMQAPCSIWMVPEGSPPTLRRVLVPVDFSEPSADALRVGASLAKMTGAECLALHVYFNEARVTFENYDRALREREQEAYAKFVAPLALDVPVVAVFEEGANPAHVINRVAVDRGCDLVVMATRGRSRSAAILLGSVTEETITDTPLPLLVVKHYGAQIGALRALLELSQSGGPQFD